MTDEELVKDAYRELKKKTPPLKTDNSILTYKSRVEPKKK